MKINLKSLFTSGLVAGIIILIVGFGLVPILGNQMDELLESQSIPPLSKGAMVFFAFVSITLGFSVVFFYALLQSKFNSKLKAAVTASLILWFLNYLLSNAALVAYGFMPIDLVVIGTAWGLLELLTAGIIGSMLYKERSSK
jgi:hypothetical protein